MLIRHTSGDVLAPHRDADTFEHAVDRSGAAMAGAVSWVGGFQPQQSQQESALHS